MFPTRDGEYVQGLELLNSYGPCPNSKLLLDYGFSILDNPHDTVRLGLELRPPTDDALVDRRRALLRRGNCSPYPTFQLRRGEAPVDALAFLRVALAPADVLSTREALPEGDDVLGFLGADDEEKEREEEKTKSEEEEDNKWMNALVNWVKGKGKGGDKGKERERRSVL